MTFEENKLIEKFLKSELNSEKNKLVLKRIESDEVFRKKVAFEKELLTRLDKSNWSFIKTNLVII